jgi:hypothetical protein
MKRTTNPHKLPCPAGTPVRIALFLGMWMGSLVCLRAQTLVNRDQSIFLTDQALMTIDGSVHTTGFVINNGTLLVSGDWTNLGSYNAGEGAVEFSGTRTQTIRHQGQSFYVLRLSGGGEKQFPEDATITQELILNQGIATPAANRIFLVAETARISGGSENSYVNGRLCQQGTGDKFFPVGKNGQYSPVMLTEITGALPVTGFERFTPNPAAKAGTGLVSVSTQGYWQKTQVSGSLNSAFLSLSSSTNDVPADGSAPVVAEADQAGGSYRSLGAGPDNGLNMISGRSPITASFFALGLAGEKTEATLYIPNAFSPSAASAEDRSLKIYGAALTPEGLTFRIYNRWGNLIFESRSLADMTSRGWNGTNSVTGKTETSGVYTYTITGKLTDGTQYKKAGTVTLIE